MSEEIWLDHDQATISKMLEGVSSCVETAGKSEQPRRTCWKERAESGGKLYLDKDWCRTSDNHDQVEAVYAGRLSFKLVSNEHDFVVLRGVTRE
jgi:hypothetical protein